MANGQIIEQTEDLLHVVFFDGETSGTITSPIIQVERYTTYHLIVEISASATVHYEISNAPASEQDDSGLYWSQRAGNLTIDGTIHNLSLVPIAARARISANTGTVSLRGIYRRGRVNVDGSTPV